MQYRVDSLGLSGGVTQIFRDLIHQRLGLSYESTHFDQLADRLAPLVVARGFGSFMDYYYFLKYSEERDEWTRVMDALAVHETYFWREIDQLRAVVDVVVPHLVRRGASSLKIWSVPCSTGEEPLTLAMLLSEAGWFARLPIELVASDASPDAIAQARAGEYGQRAFRNLPAAMKEKYFSPSGNKWRIAPDLQQRVSYDVVNLVAEDEARRHASAPIIVCRNVFIYFSEESIRRAIGVFERAMPVPGYLCVGASESLLRRTVTFELQEVGGAFMYVKDAPLGHPPDSRLSGVERAS
jgi:chemotaxis protein methyltransferase CheR